MGPDTKRGWMPEKTCSDCGCLGCSWGSKSPNIVPEVDPEGPFKHFCAFCYEQRQKRVKKEADPFPLGVKPPGVPERFSGEITVVTKSGSEYHFTPPDKDDIRSVSCETRDIGFIKCKILLLQPWEGMWFRGIDVDPEIATWETSTVLAIS